MIFINGLVEKKMQWLTIGIFVWLNNKIQDVYKMMLLTKKLLTIEGKTYHLYIFIKYNSSISCKS